MKRAVCFAHLLALLGLCVALNSANAAEEMRRVRIAIVYPESRAAVGPAAEVFVRRLGELGWVEGRNLTIESRWADGKYEAFAPLISEVVGLKVDLLVTWTTAAALAAKSITAKSGLPVVVPVMGDPIATGIVSDLAHPGGNLTGFALGHDQAFAGKWVQILQDTIPRLSAVTAILNPDSPVVRKQGEALKPAAQALGVTLRFVEVRRPEELAPAFATARRQSQAFVLLADPLTMQYRRDIAKYAEKQKIPGVYSLREFVDAGGLMSYGADNNAVFYRAAEYADRVLRGEHPRDLPIEQATKFQFVVNLKAAKQLRMRLPQSILVRADDVVQ